MTNRLPRLHLVTDPQVCPFDRLLSLLPALLAAGIEAVHLRTSALPAGELLDLARRLRRLIVPPAALIVNDRVDVALLAEADGVQLPERGLPVDAARRLLGGGRWIGRSVHDVEAAREAALTQADYLLYGHVFESASKPGVPARGLTGLRAVAGAVPLPVIAIGGVVPERVAEVVAAGAYGIAVIRGILTAEDPVAAVEAFRRALDEAGP